MFTPEHDFFWARVRRFVEKEIVPHAEAWEAAGEFPRALWRQLGELGLLGLEYPPATTIARQLLGTLYG